ncbi:MAG: hypothetical protein GF384_03210, partial [Elusimicrobia bacterium]|nr:hypothetical protein [Elusimicrobiota bacterium]MBD3411935.1 hypothetical protein [Elusimicrobiota bacterium]
IPARIGTTAVGGFITALPGVQISKTTRSAATILLNYVNTVLASDLYTIDLSRAQVNRDLTISLNYDKTKVTDTDSVKIYQYNETTGQWDVVPGTVMVDPILGTASIDAGSIGNASGTIGMNQSGKACFDGRRHAPNVNAVTEQSGTFAVFAAPPANAKAYTGTEFKAYNFPNPFDLTSKTMTLNDDITVGAAMDVRGTIIKYYMPASVSGSTRIYIYNLAGEMVREIDEGDREGGYIYYSEWDGRNDNGSSVASGVYFCMVQVNGDKKALFKMAVIK